MFETTNQYYIYNISILNHDDYRTSSPLLAQFQAVRPASHVWFIQGGAAPVVPQFGIATSW